eukprot:5724512-Prymnesium_polylepis.1
MMLHSATGAMSRGDPSLSLARIAAAAMAQIVIPTSPPRQRKRLGQHPIKGTTARAPSTFAIAETVLSAMLSGSSTEPYTPQARNPAKRQEVAGALGASALQPFVAPGVRCRCCHAGLSGMQVQATRSSKAAGAPPTSAFQTHPMPDHSIMRATKTPKATAGANVASSGLTAAGAAVSLTYRGFASVQKPMPTPRTTRPAQSTGQEAEKAHTTVPVMMVASPAIVPNLLPKCSHTTPLSGEPMKAPNSTSEEARASARSTGDS